jgi:transcriptional regulator with XRE-family HTH domain
MHALRRFIQSELDNRGWQARDLVKASGLSKQLVSNLLNDDREAMPQLPRTATLEALANAFNVTTAHITTVAVEALGIPGVQAPAVVHQIHQVDDEVLLRELLRRAVTRESGEVSPGASVAVLPVRRRPLSEIEAELRVAMEDLADWDAQEVPGQAAKSHREELRARVDALEAELVASRHATGVPDSVAEL